MIQVKYKPTHIICFRICRALVKIESVSVLECDMIFYVLYVYRHHHGRHQGLERPPQRHRVSREEHSVCGGARIPNHVPSKIPGLDSRPPHVSHHLSLSHHHLCIIVPCFLAILFCLNSNISFFSFSTMLQSSEHSRIPYLLCMELFTAIK